MRLQKHKTRKDKEYYKYVVVLPLMKIEKAGFKEGDDLFIEAKEGEVVLRKVKKELEKG